LLGAAVSGRAAEEEKAAPAESPPAKFSTDHTALGA